MIARRLLLTALALAGLGMARPPAPPPTATPSPAPAPPALVVPPDHMPFTDAPDAIGITVEGGENENDDSDNSLTATTEFRIQFPDAMIPADRIDATDAASPITVWPDLGAKWIWRTQSQGVWRVNGPVIPGQKYRLRLRDGLTTLTGKPLATAKWGYEVEASPLTVESESYERESLGAQPQIPLEFNYPIRLADAAAGCWIQNRLTRERFPVEILLNQAVSEVTGDVVDVSNADAQPAPREFRVRPRAPLPVGQFYDLVVEGIADAYAGRTLPYPRVFALGRTRFYAIDYVAARNWPTDKPHIEVKFRGALGEAPLPPDALTIEPAVANLRLRKEGEYLLADGDFDPTKRYRVTIAAGITSDRGYPLARPEVWGATFRPKPATLLFPEGILRQRAALGLRFALLQANTGPVTWRLAAVPLDRLDEVRRAVTAGDRLVIDALGLHTLAQGEIPASGNDEEVVRPITWQPADGAPALSGPSVLEASARDLEGRTITNRALVFFNETVFTQKTTPGGTILRLARMSDGQPLAGIPVEVLSATLDPLARGVTDPHGAVTFPASSLAGAAFFRAATPGTPAVELATPGSSFPNTGSTYTSPVPPYRGEVIPDRPLVRPGEEVKFKGFVRRIDFDGLLAPGGAKLAWEIVSEDRGDKIATGTTTINEFGGWDAAWNVPPQGRVGGFRVVARIGETLVGSPGFFRVEEFRNPPFSVVCEPQSAGRAGESVLTVSSQYFHGAPNVGSRVQWKATWLSDSDGEYYNDSDPDGFLRVDLYSEQRRAPAFEAEASGEATLDERGQAVLKSSAPFVDPGLRARCEVLWRVDVTGPDGQTISGGASEKVTMNDVTLGVRADREATGRGQVVFDVQTETRPGITAPAEIAAELFLVQTKSVKERLAPFVFRYRNTDRFVRVDGRNVPPNGRVALPAKSPGRYVLVLRPPAGVAGIPVSEEFFVEGEGEAELPVESDQTLTLQPVTKDTPVAVGSTAAFNLLAPSPGVAWVTVETDRVLDTFTVDLPGNSSRIEIPVKPSYAPGVHVSAYVLRPGNADSLPGEMYGVAELPVSRAASTIDLALTTDRPEYQPRETGRITVQATSGGRNLANTEVTLYAVDDSILTLGGWTLPALPESFFPENPFAVATRLALTGYVDRFDRRALTQKGSIVGSAGKDEFGNTQFVRRDFRPLVLWLPSLRTDAAGRATAKFTTPDNLTQFRVIALAQNRANQFGAGNTTFTVSKPVLIEPALPRFLRAGDEIQLRAVARQKAADSADFVIRADVGDGLRLIDSAPARQTGARNEPVVARFRARVSDTASQATVRFAVESPVGRDEVEITLPIAPATIEVREAVAGKTSSNRFTPADHAPPAWTKTPGSLDVVLSTSPDFTRLLGLPTVLDYPYGCLEQKSSRLLAYTALAPLLAYLPQSAERRENYRRVISESLEEFERSLLPDDTLPYWPFGTTTNAFVTIQSAWAVAQAEQAGIDVPGGLAAALPRAVSDFALRRSRLEISPSLRAFALFALAQLGRDPDAETLAAARELYLERARLTDEARGFLALAMRAWDVEPAMQATLAAEMPAHPEARAFNPDSFSSTDRALAITTMVRLGQPNADPAALRAGLTARMSDATNLSTQENLWLLLAFAATLEASPPAKLPANLTPPPDARAENGSAAAWLDRPLAELDRVAFAPAGPARTFALLARRTLAPAEQTPVTRGLRLDRVVKNLTDPTRTGSPEAPFRLGDQILISFRFQCDEAQSYVALEDALPSGLEVLNPNLEMIGKFYQIPDEPGAPAAWLSFSEMRARQTNLFFDSLSAGAHSYAILARATSAGSFAWPSAQIAPMYDARFYGRSAPTRCVVTE